ncbi:MAG: hypothetical protein A2156_03630 [Deltaproteobacteria bacterium RBG_16_48_10]|nr:MAG: hypothetical protein A2156_03630 [Deltaproteobacteria bacterium RBG_16_48_10]
MIRYRIFPSPSMGEGWGEGGHEVPPPLHPLKLGKNPKIHRPDREYRKNCRAATFSGSTIRIKKLSKIAKLRWFVSLTFSMSASYDFGESPCSVSHLPIISHLPSHQGRGDFLD